MTTNAKLTAMPLTPRIGSEILADVDTLLGGAHAGEIRRLLEERGVLVFRGVHFTDDQQLAFARMLGKIHGESPTGILKVSADKSVNPNPAMAEYQRSSVYWHFDGFGDEVPMLATMLNPRGLARTGGQTEVANAYAAYDDLPDEDKRMIENLHAVHSFETMMRVVVPWPTYAELSGWQSKRQPRTQPVVWHHRSGRKSLVLGASASHIEGMSLPEGRALLCRLCEWATQPQYVYRHEWKMGDLLIWSNTGTLHRALPYALDSGRIMHRTTLVGEEVPV